MKHSLKHFVDSLAQGMTIDTNTANQRLDRFLRKLFRPHPDISLVMIFKAIRKWQIKILPSWSSTPQKTKENHALTLGDQIYFHPSFLETISTNNPITKTVTRKTHTPQWELSNFQSRIITEDDEWLIINKPAGISIHPGQANNETPKSSLYDLIKQYYSSRGFAGSMFQPNVAYRLDKETSGLVIVAKTYAGLQHLNTQIREHKVDKSYYTIVVGDFPKQLTLTKPMKKIVDKQFWRGKMVICHPHEEDAQSAYTIGHKEKVRSDPVLGTLSLVKVKIKTGRMHQIRVHMADAGYPVLGDIVYGIPSYNRRLHKQHHIRRQLLHCREYSFQDMHGQIRTFQAPLQEDMKKLTS